jgi:metal-responsive CopG/Arc/MetJ family transcriptional regulator
MTDRSKIRIVVDEDAPIVERLDAMAEAEGLSRSDMLRRAIRRLIFSPNVPTFGNIPESQTADITA